MDDHLLFCPFYRITKSVDDALQLSDTYGVQQMDFGHATVLFIMSVITSLIDCTIEDYGLQLVCMDKHGNAYSGGGHQLMDIDDTTNSNGKRNEHREHLRRTNALMAVEVAEKISSNKRTKAFFRLFYINMYVPFIIQCFFAYVQYNNTIT